MQDFLLQSWKLLDFSCIITNIRLIGAYIFKNYFLSFVVTIKIRKAPESDPRNDVYS